MTSDGYLYIILGKVTYNAYFQIQLSNSRFIHALVLLLNIGQLHRNLNIINGNIVQVLHFV